MLLYVHVCVDTQTVRSTSTTGKPATGFTEHQQTWHIVIVTFCHCDRKPGKSPKKRKRLFRPTVSETSVQSWLALLNVGMCQGRYIMELGAWQKKHYSLHGSQEEEKEREEGREMKHVLQRHGIHDIFLPATTYLLVPAISQKCHQFMNHQLIHNWLGQSSHGTNTSPKLCLWALPWGSRL